MPTGDVLAKLREQLKQIKEPPKSTRKPASQTDIFYYDLCNI